jgi:hypothetical protein
MLSVLPFKHKIGTITQCPFPGAYIIVGGTGANAIVPVYTSMPNFFATGLIEFLNSKSAQVIVLPGYSLQLFAYLNSGTSITFDNTGGTDILYRNASLGASSCKLSYKFISGTNELVSNLSNVTLTINQYDAVSDVTYLSTTYRCFEFKSTTQTYTFAVTDPANTSLTCLFLLVGGGGGGGNASTGVQVAGSGGGGAGAFVYGTISITPGFTFNITVGAGGAGNQDATGIGSPSIITRTVNGGGVDATLNVGGGGSGGGQHADGQIFRGSYPSGIGGSSGGVCPLFGATQQPRPISTTKHTTTGTSGVFTNITALSSLGGSSFGNRGGSGGGGAGGAGQTIIDSLPGVAYGGGGGAGTNWPVIGSSRVFAAGGGGNNSRDTGKVGEGGQGGSIAIGNLGASAIRTAANIGGSGGFGNAGAANTGSGGGAIYSGTPGAGGSGICIIAVPISRLAG